MTAHSDAIADLAETVGQALIQFAEQVRSHGESTAGAPAASGATRGGLGPSQSAVYEALVAAGENGLTAKEAAEKCDLKSTNTPQILAKLGERALARATGERPKVWRAAPREG